MLLALSEALEAPVSTLLGEAVPEQETDELKAISEKLEVINLRFARQKAARRRVIRCLLLALCAATVLLFAGLLGWGSPYLDWDYSDPERAVVGVALHAFEWMFVRAAPIILAGALLGLFLTTEAGIASQSAPFDLFRALPGLYWRGRAMLCGAFSGGWRPVPPCSAPIPGPSSGGWPTPDSPVRRLLRRPK